MTFWQKMLNKDQTSSHALIANAVPVNLGDAALVFGLARALQEEGVGVTIATHYLREVAQRYEREAPFVPDFLATSGGRWRRGVRLALAALLLARKGNGYRDVDVVVAAPGGYINSYYRLFPKLYVLWLCATVLKKRVVIYSQSIGPLSGRDQHWLARFLPTFDLVLVRDSVSEELTSRVAPNSKIVRTNDAAFLLHPLMSHSQSGRSAAISVRRWDFDGRQWDKYAALIVALTQMCVEAGYRVVFLSTCQGVPGYIDDSAAALEIVSMLPDEVRNKITVDGQRYDLDEFRERLRGFSFVIGTRLHMCILSILSGVPALNISYEAKGTECYRSIGLSHLSIDYNADPAVGARALEELLESLESLRSRVGRIAQEQHAIAKRHLGEVLAALRPSSQGT